MFAKTDEQDRNAGAGRREWLLPVALFFVSVGALARLVMELRLTPGQQVLGRWLGPGPTMVLLTGMAGLGIVWYLRGAIAFPFRKVLGLLVFCLPLACFLGTLQGVPDAGGQLWGGSAGRTIARALPAVVGVGGTGLLMLFSLVLAWKLAFTASQGLFTDPLSPALRPAFAGLPAAGGAAALRAPVPGSAADDGSRSAAAEADVEDDLATAEPLPMEEEGSLFAPRPALESPEADSDAADDVLAEAAEAEDEGLPAHLAVPALSVPEVLDGLLPESSAGSPPGAPEAVLALRAGEDEEFEESDAGIEARLLALEEIESRRAAAPAPEPAPEPASTASEVPSAPPDEDDTAAFEIPRGALAAEGPSSLLAYDPPGSGEDSPEELAQAEPDLFAGRRLMFRTGERVALTDEEVEAELDADDDGGEEIEEPSADTPAVTPVAEAAPAAAVPAAGIVAAEEDDEELFGEGVPEDPAADAAAAVEEGDAFDDDNDPEDDDAMPPLFALQAAEAPEEAEETVAGVAARRPDSGEPAVGEAPPPGTGWRGIRAPRAEDEPTVVLSRVRTEEAPSPGYHLRAEMEAEAGASAGGPSPTRPGAAAGEDWATWDDDTPPRPRTRAPKPRRAARPGDADAAATLSGEGQDADDQQVLFAHGSDVDDEVYRRAVDLVIAEDRCSAAMLQRMLPATFSEATAIIDRMHDEGVVGPQLPSGRRELLRR